MKKRSSVSKSSSRTTLNSIGLLPGGECFHEIRGLFTGFVTSPEKPVLPHDWNVGVDRAREIQDTLRPLIRTDLRPPRVRRIAGVDVTYVTSTGTSVAAVAVLSFPDLVMIESASGRTKTRFPYVPGLLSFRECPAILLAFEKLAKTPDLVFVDGHGFAHPRRFGLACHLGLWLQLPTIGIGKSRLCGEFQDPPVAKGSRSGVYDKGELIGMALRTRENVKPVFVSVGFGIPLDNCVDLSLKACSRYRLPEPIRQADHLARIFREQLARSPKGQAP